MSSERSVTIESSGVKKPKPAWFLRKTPISSFFFLWCLPALPVCGFLGLPLASTGAFITKCLGPYIKRPFLIRRLRQRLTSRSSPASFSFLAIALGLSGW